MIYAEVFAGAGGMSLGLERSGMKCAWHAEIEERARKALEKHWPDVPLLWDVRNLDGAGQNMIYGQIDLLSGGSPCQGMSIAGKRKGLQDNRSILFYEQMRLWDETKAPLCLWENVCGALSSNQGKDFARVLGAFVGGRITVPRHPRSRKRIPWARSGIVVGSTGVAAWRVLNAEFFGVPQRRRRVFVLGSRTGRYDPAKILLEPESVFGNPESRISPREKDSRIAGSGFEGSSRKVLSFHHKQDPDAHLISPPLGITAQGMGVVNRMLGFGDYKEDHVASAIKSRDYKDVTDIVAMAGRPRRFMPIECERLMGWPDGHTFTEGTTDTPRYILCGNGCVADQAEWIGRRISGSQQGYMERTDAILSKLNNPNETRY